MNITLITILVNDWYTKYNDAFCLPEDPRVFLLVPVQKKGLYFLNKVTLFKAHLKLT